MLTLFILRYAFIGLIFNLIYDLTIYYMNKEELRFSILERIIFTIIWPVYAAILIHNFIKTIIYGPDDEK